MNKKLFLLNVMLIILDEKEKQKNCESKNEKRKILKKRW